MKIRIQTLVPGGFFLFSLGYLAFVLTMRSSGMIGDTRGYDPGSRLVPLVSVIVLGALSLWLLIQEIHRAGVDGVPSGLSPLFWANVAISVAYVALFRHLGYIATTGLSLYWLIALNLRAIGVGFGRMGIFGWLGPTLAYLLLSFGFMRAIIKGSFWLARAQAMPWAREPVTQALASSVALTLLFLVVGKALKRLAPNPETALMVQVVIGATMSIYIVFRLLFLVQLPTGPLTW